VASLAGLNIVYTMVNGNDELRWEELVIKEQVAGGVCWLKWKSISRNDSIVVDGIYEQLLVYRNLFDPRKSKT
jgi:hypothetical protein